MKIKFLKRRLNMNSQYFWSRAVAIVLLIFLLVWVVDALIARDKPINMHKGLLNGKTFAVEMIEKGKQEGQHDSFRFRKGKFHSTACDRYGFGTGKYRASREGDTISFEVETVSKKEGKLNWKGTVKGGMVEGTAIWTKGGQAPMEYTFHGKSK
jgi:hypothetical protein